MSTVKLASRYFRHRLKAGNEHGLHSPFVYELYTEVIKSKDQFYHFEEIENLRKRLLESEQRIQVTDFGAGSRIFKGDERAVAGIAKHVLKPENLGQLLFRLVNRFKPKTIVELGTSLGITTLYLAAPDSSAEVHTLEGCPATLSVAQDVFDDAKATNITTYSGRFSETLPGVLQSINKLDFAFIDGHHAYQPTVDYFLQCLPFTDNDSVLVFDDIHWSDEMEQAWHEIKNHESVCVSIDLFHLGLIFFRKEQKKEHFQLRF